MSNKILLISENQDEFVKSLMLDYEIKTAVEEEQIIQTIHSENIDLILLDSKLENNCFICRKFEIPIIFFSDANDPQEELKCLTLGATDYISKNVNIAKARLKNHFKFQKQNMQLMGELKTIQGTLQDATSHLENLLSGKKLPKEQLKTKRKQNTTRAISSRLEGVLLGESGEVKKIKESIFQFAMTNDHLLLHGPSDAGEEAIAKAIHNLSMHSKKPFVYVNCSQLDSDTKVFSLSDLKSKKENKFQMAAGGVLYLSEVHSLTEKLQEQLKEFLAEIEKEGPKTRVISHTSHDLAKTVEEMKFDKNLYELLNTSSFTIPPLHKRKEDIPQLADYFVKEYARRFSKTIEKISDDSIKRLVNYKWPNNIRGLRSVIKRTVEFSTKPILEISEEDLRGDLYIEHYRLINKIDSGGMGEVWSAQHQTLEKTVAIKLIRSDVLTDVKNKNSNIRRFLREARAIANLESPHTIKLSNYGVTDKGEFYYVMEFLKGMDLLNLVEKFGPIPAERAIFLLKQACRSLMEAHVRDIVHRDIKPENLFVCKLGIEHDFLKILDFGVVKFLNPKGASANLTQVGDLVGSPTSMAPELVTQMPIDERTDIYALGCVAYWMLTKKQVFSSNNLVQLIMKHATAKPIPPTHVGSGNKIPAKLEEIVMKCLEKEKENRHSSVGEMLKLLGQVELENQWGEEQAQEWWHKNLPEID